MPKLPRDYDGDIEPNYNYDGDIEPGYDYDGDMEAMYEDWRKYFDPEEENESSVVELFDNSEFPSTTDACPICRDGNFCQCGQLEEHNDYDYGYDQMDDSCEYCFTCGIHVPTEGHYISADVIVCKCSPLYPDLRPSDYPHKICSCSLVKYEYLGETICSCSSPDLYALLERQHELNLTLNLTLLEHEPPPALEESDNEETCMPF